jgi:hypothetical protein
MQQIGMEDLGMKKKSVKIVPQILTDNQERWLSG